MQLYVHSSTIYNGQDMEATCSSTNEWIKNMWYLYTMEYYPQKKWNIAICSNMDGTYRLSY